MIRRGVWLLSLLAATGCARSSTLSAPVKSDHTPRRVTLVATAELHGTTEPCGCNSDPLGDLARLVALAKGGLLLDAGDLLYDGKPADGHRAQADRKAAVIGGTYALAGAEVALGPNDLAGGVTALQPARQACNVLLARGLASPRVHEIDGLRVGVFGVSHLGAVTSAQRAVGLEVIDELVTAPRAIAQLEQQHAEVVVALLAMSRTEARAFLKKVPGIDFAIFGLDVAEGMPEPEPVGDAWLVAPADQGRRAAKIEIVRGDRPMGARLHPARFEGDSGRVLALVRLDKRQTALEQQLAGWAKDPSADPGFVAARRKELAELTEERKRTATATLTPPSGAYFTYTLQPIRRTLPRDPAVAAALQQLARDNGHANLVAAQSEPPPARVAGKPGYVGGAACARCHKAAAAFWQTTHHAEAWKTLVAVDKQYDYDCVRCHVTAWQEPGGSNLATVEKQGLTAVQCEVCHGPGERHVTEDGLEDPKTMQPPPAELCRNRCHTMEHSDTFALDPYLRDILGVGHGEARRKALGEGPTGHALRQAALAAAAR